MSVKAILSFMIMSIVIAGAQAQIANNVTFRDNLTYSNEMSDVWGWENPADGKEYAIATLTNGVSLVEVSNPDAIVQRDFISGVNSLWRDAKTWGDYAYVVTEGGGGMLIIDMADLPGTVSTNTWNGGIGFSSAHNIFIDENGYGYLCGSNGSLGTVIVDLNANPTNPPVVGSYTTRYVHDLYVENDIMYTAEINNGIFSVIDVSTKSSPVVLATQSTSSNFTHNIWLSDDGDYVFTTDEVNNANVDAYNISDLSDINEVDRFRPGTTGSSIPHNTFVKGNLLFTAWYRDGLRITDATIPENMIEVGWYDTSPLSGGGFNGAWGTYPYLPSGNVLVSDIEGGLFVLTPSYIGAAFLSGSVTDAGTSGLIFDATVSIISGPSTTTDVFGQYQTGLAGGGTLSVQVSKTGYVTQTITGISLTAGVTTNLDVALVPNVSITVSGNVTSGGSAVPFANVQFIDVIGNINNTAANASGFYSINIFSDTYDIIAGKWGYITGLTSGTSILSSTTINLSIDEGYYDDFTLDFGWTIANTATTGVWTRAEPIATDFDGVPANVNADIPGDISNQCYMTGNGGGAAGTDDIDGGRTVLISPVFDLTGYSDPYIDYSRWFFNDGGSSAPNDTLLVTLSNGSATATIETVLDGDPAESSWKEVSIRVSDFIAPTSNMVIRFASSDLPSAGGHLVEAAVDGFEVIEGGVSAVCAVPTNPIATGITSTSVTVMWDAMPTATIYQIEGRKVGTPTFRAINTTAPTKTISILNTTTTYEWRVRARCADGTTSAFSSLNSFTTLSPRIGKSETKISPNPVSEGIANVTLTASNAGIAQMSIYSFNGTLVYQSKVALYEGFNSIPVSVSDFQSGMYLLNIEKENFSFTGRLNVIN